MVYVRPKTPLLWTDGDRVLYSSAWEKRTEADMGSRCEDKST